MGRLAAVLLLSLGLALPSHASEGGLTELIIQAANLALLLGVLVYFARKPIQGFFQDRRTQIKGELDEAAGLLQTAESRYDEWQRRLIDLESEIERIRAEGQQRAEAETAAILEDARAAAERIKRDAAAAVEHELRRAQSALRAEAAQLATEMAERILRERLGDPDRERLMDEFIARVEARS